jgi:hypothetical protein
METVPAVRVPNTVPEAPGKPGWGARETSPVGVPDPLVTEILKVTFWPWLRAVSVAGKVEVIVEVVALKLVVTVPQFVTRFDTFTDPRPVARSYPAVVVQPGVVLLEGSTRTPIAFAAAVLQSGVASKSKRFGNSDGKEPTQGTELLPFVTSLKVQDAFGPVEELQFKPAVPYCFAAS